ncbi:ABC transporter ATP-binding protein [Xanthobacter sp. VTT E-85241]|uniref:ABC transporter ATP-binding protein n=1 Tax=Roseixanthobacter finlandensis TaxID=3119922 RepID=UPI00372C4F34
MLALHRSAQTLSFGETQPRNTQAPAYIEVRDLVAAFGAKIVVKGVSFAVGRGEHLSLLGPSGCGKSTTLRCIAGLETPVSGEIVIDGNLVFSSSKRVNVPTEKRKLSMVFQSYAIWPHMTVFENVAYGLRVQRVAESEIKQRVVEMLRMVGIEDYIHRPATDLSGGQQQRVALARSYASRPKAILLDEPLSNLDARLRVRMRDEIKEFQHKFDLSTIYVTHDQEEAMAISDRIIVMRDGHIEQCGKPLDIYDTPCTRFVADFIGAANILAGTAAGEAPSGAPVLKVGEALVECAEGSQLFPVDAGGLHLAALRTVYPEMRRDAPPRPNQWPAIVTRRVLLGDIVNYTLAWPGGDLRVHAFPNALFEEGERIQLHIPPHRTVPVRAD